MPLRNRSVYAAAGGAVMATGLIWRSGELPLSGFAAKYGGDALWALLVFIGLGFLFRRTSTLRVAAASLAFAGTVEFAQLYHAPWIDSIRATRMGSLILGSTFNPPDFVAYAIGIAVGALMEHLLRDGRIMRASTP